VTVDGKSFENYDDYPASQLGRITLREAVAYSCNTAFLSSRERLGDGDLADAAASLGFGVDQDLGFPAYFREVPPPRSETEAAAGLIGHGTVLASPLAMATVAASVQAGRTVVPHLLEGFEPSADPATPLTPDEAGSLRELMRAVVTEGSGSFLGDVPGSVGAKTGTAEYGEPGPDGEPATHAWMIATRADLAVAVFVETGESGSSTAGPLLERFLDADASAGG
jgi:cell division protein FtsI/penicillin-binding protein 2